MRGLSRFERRILLAISVVVVCAVFGAVLFGYATVRGAYRIGVNPEVVRELQGGVAARRAQLVARRELADRIVHGLAHDVRIDDALKTGDRTAIETILRDTLDEATYVDRLSVTKDDEVVAEVARERDPRIAMRPLSRTVDVEGLDVPADVSIVVVEPESTFTDFERAGEQAELFSRLDESREFVSNVYIGVYVAVVVAVALGAMALGVLLARRVTRQVGVLAEANRRVGQGDLDVSVPKGSNDEIGELTTSFNTMVRDLRDSRTRIEYLQRIGAWQEFARRLAHEIKNPLTPIQLAAQEVHRSYRGDDAAYRRKLEEATAIIEEEVATLRRLVSEFSAFARLPTAELVESDLRDFLADVARTLPGLVEDVIHDDAARVDLRVEVPRVSIPVRIDAMMLKRGVDNLVRNAVQAVSASRPDGGGRVLVRARREGDTALILIDDDGPGVAPDDRERVFDPYFTTKSEGTGLGLPIVKKVVLEHGGTVALETSPFGGARFVLSLPLATPSKPA